MLPTIEEFNYISNETFRQCIESDWRELNEALQTKSWKGAMVLGGSIIEAMLADSLYSEGGGTNGVLRSDLSVLIDDCHTKKIIKDDTKKACEVIKDFRNLIHPGRTVRLGTQATEGKASLTRSLVLIVAGDIAANRKATYGYTAEQVLNKMFADPSALFSIKDSLLRKVNDWEKERLLLRMLPNTHQATREEAAAAPNAQKRKMFTEHLRSIRWLNSHVFEASPEGIKKKAARVYCDLLYEGSGSDRRHFERGLLLPKYIDLLEESEKQLVRKGLLSSLREEQCKELLQATKGLGKWFATADCFSDLLSIFFAAVHSESDKADEWMEGILYTMGEEAKGQFRDYVKSKNRYPARSLGAQCCERLLDLPRDIPF